ncbi:MAG: hypothetical protein F4X64_05775 [Chloroflexi bacterium]|nr:hypothetical protein [Chloroflexota bacterium]
MPLPRDRETIHRLAYEIYVKEVRGQLTPHDDGRWVAVDAFSGNYRIDYSARSAVDMLKYRHNCDSSTIWIHQINLDL